MGITESIGSLLKSLHSEEAMREAEIMYSSTFRTPGFLVEGDTELRDEAIALLTEPFIEYVEDEFGYDFERIKPAKMSLEEAEKVVDTTRFTWLVNYKGECEGGLEVESDVLHLQVYRGRRRPTNHLGIRKSQRSKTMGYTTESSITNYWPDDTDTKFYIADSATLAEIIEKAVEKWGFDPEVTLGKIKIEAEYIHTNYLTYPHYDAGDWTNFIVVSIVK